MMPVISTLLHHRLRARSLFEECAWGFSFREKRGTSYPPSTRDKFFDEFFWQGTKILVWKIHLILFIFISFYDNFYKSGIMRIMVILFFFTILDLKGHDVSNGKQKSCGCDCGVQSRSRTHRVTHRVINEVSNAKNWLLTTNRKSLRKLKSWILSITYVRWFVDLRLTILGRIPWFRFRNQVFLWSKERIDLQLRIFAYRRPFLDSPCPNLVGSIFASCKATSKC